MHANDDESQQQGLLCKIMEQQNYEGNRNEDGKNMLKNKKITKMKREQSHCMLKKMLIRNGVMQKCV